MEFFSHKTNIDFMGMRKWTALFSVVLVIASIAALAVNGLNWGLDFTGGNQIVVHYQQEADFSQIREQLKQAGFKETVVQSYGDSKRALIRLGPQSNEGQQTIVKEVLAALPGASVLSSDFIGPQVGKELAISGALALLVAMLGTAVYIAFRFEYRFAVSSAVALIHDPVLILGIFAFFHVEFNLIALAAMLTVIGYSLNDTIVVFDRVRENFRKLRKATAVEVVNLSVNETLSRTIMTSALTLLSVVVLFFWGGEVVHNFALAMMIGIVVGTYSSIYVAGALAVAMGLNKKDLMPPSKEEIDDRP